MGMRRAIWMRTPILKHDRSRRVLMLTAVCFLYCGLERADVCTALLLRLHFTVFVRGER